MSFKVEPFGEHEGKAASKITLENKGKSLQCSIITYGAAIQSFRQNGVEVQLGLDTLSEYVHAAATGCLYFGATIGRYANRIGKGVFTLEGRTFNLNQNNNGNSLHGGPGGLHAVFWGFEVVEGGEYPVLRLRYTSPKGEEGFPGTLAIVVSYTLTETDLVMEFEATTDQPTHVNLTNHAFWNLADWQSGHDALGHVLEVQADRYAEVDDGLIPTGRLLPVDGTPFDFRTPHTLQERNDQVGVNGYDNCLVLQAGLPNSEKGIPFAGRLTDPASGRGFALYTTQPSLQIYVGGFLRPTTIMGGYRINRYYCCCLEAQHLADTPNRPEFPSTLLRPGEKYYQKTIHEFFTMKQQPGH